MPQKCPFCQILKGEQESERVYEDRNVLGVLDIRPSAPGHTLIIPKEHVGTISELSESMIGALFNAVKEVIWKLEESLDPDGFNVGWNHGKAAGQAIPHLHIHVIPRFEDDKGGPVQAVVRNEPEEDISTIAERIRSGSKPSKQRSKVAKEAEKKERKKEEGGEREGKTEKGPEKKRPEKGEKPKTTRPDLESIPGSEDELVGSHAEPTPQEQEKEEREEKEEEEESDEKRKWKEMKKPRY